MDNFALSLEDRAEIFDLFAKYNHYFDEGLGEEWASCFAPEGSFSGPAGKAKGGEELAMFCRKTIKEYPDALHFTDHHLFEFEGELLKHKCILSVQYPVHGEVSILLCRYHDELVLGPDGWKFLSRKVSQL